MVERELRFSGSIPKRYDELMVPLFFRPYAEELTRRATSFQPRQILETAAGTGALTQALLNALPGVEIAAIDLNEPMLVVAAEHVASSRVKFMQGDAQELQFDDETFDLVMCQFGAMFFPEKAQAHAEARRVLRDRGHYLLAIWDEIERNRLSEIAQNVLIDLFPVDPPLFMQQGPYGYHDPRLIEHDLLRGGFNSVEIETLELRSRSPSAHFAATALCYGTPMGVEVEERERGSMERVFEVLVEAFRSFERQGEIDLPMSAHLVTAIK